MIENILFWIMMFCLLIVALDRILSMYYITYKKGKK